MNVSSGTIPYNYNVVTPIMANTTIISPSSEMIEQGQFVITAELRKWLSANSEFVLPSFRTYQHPAIPPSSPYEPNTSGINQLGKNQTILAPITETRRALENLFSVYSTNSPYGSGEHHVDWILQSYPVSLSGQTNDNYPGWTRREAASGVVLDTDVNVLGGSGVYVDLDFGEIMFNPYPFHANTIHYGAYLLLTNVAFSLNINKPDTPIVVSPFFPSFQKTDGSLVSLNGREQLHPSGYGLYQVDHVGSGKVRLDGYGVDENTTFYLQDTNSNVLLTPFSYFKDGLRGVGNIFGLQISGQNINQSRVFLTPSSISSGVYKSRLSNISNFTTVSSGNIGLWPHPSSTYPMTTSGFINRPGLSTSFGDNQNSEISIIGYNEGYEVFDSAFWIPNSSGVVIRSPFTGRPLWVRNADLSQTAASISSSWSVLTEDMELFGTDLLKVNSTEVVSGPTNDIAFWFEKYDTSLDKVSSTLSDPTVGPTSITHNLRGFATDGSSTIWTLVALFATTSNSDTIAEYDSSFGIVEEYFRDVAGQVKLNDIHYIGGGNLVGTGRQSPDNGNKIYPITFVSPVAPDPIGDFSLGSAESIDFEPIVGASFPSNQVTINKIKVAGGVSSELPNGVWASVRLFGPWPDDAVLGTYLLRLSTGGIWNILQWIKVETNDSLRGFEILEID